MSKIAYLYHRYDSGFFKDLRREIILSLLFPFLYLQIIFLRSIFPFRRFFSNYQKLIVSIYIKLSKKSFKWAINGLKTAFPEKKDDEIEKMAKESFACIVKGFLFNLATSRITKKQRFFQFVDIEGEEHLKQAYDRGKGVICLVPHMSSWELAATTPPMLGYETSAVSESIKCALFQKMAVKFREQKGMKNITRKGSYKKLVEVLKKGECLVIMIDQDTKVRGTFVDFFGKQAYTPLGAARLALDTDSAVVPMAMTEKPDGNYRFIIYPEQQVVKTGNAEKDLHDNTQNQTKMMEQIIREFPTQWVWMHRRWHHTPKSIQDYYNYRAWRKDYLESLLKK